MDLDHGVVELLNYGGSTYGSTTTTVSTMHITTYHKMDLKGQDDLSRTPHINTYAYIPLTYSRLVAAQRSVVVGIRDLLFANTQNLPRRTIPIQTFYLKKTIVETKVAKTTTLLSMLRLRCYYTAIEGQMDI